MSLFFHSCLKVCQSRPLDWTILTILGKDIKLRSPSSSKLLQPPVNSCIWDANVSFSTKFSNTRSELSETKFYTQTTQQAKL
jgi:hypothetical protein